MSTKILFISPGVSFMGKTIKKKLEGAGFDVLRVDPTIVDLGVAKDESDVLVYCPGKFSDEVTKFLIYLDELCVREQKYLILLGSPDETDYVQDKITPEILAAKFQRPIDFDRLFEAIRRFAKNVAEEKGKPVEIVEEQKSILLVDDDPTFLKMMKNWLDSDYKVTIVTSGTQALMYLADNKPDLILLDYEMPVISGPQVLEMIRSESNVGDVPIIFLTGKGDRESVIKVLALKPDGYLLKSLNREQILSSVKDFFDKKN